MKWSNRHVLKDMLGQRRTVRKFLLFPRQFGTSLTRWLEYADIEEEVKEVDVGGLDEWGCFAYRWVEVGFSEELMAARLMGEE